MNIVISLIVGLLFASSVCLMLHRSFFKLILGVIIFGYATIFFLFAGSGLDRALPPLLIDAGVDEELSDALPQALTLTAIVISIGMQLFVIALFKKAYESTDTEDIDYLNASDFNE